MYHLQKYIDYIKNTGGSLAVEQFDEDWEPIGFMVRGELIDKGLISIYGNTITLHPISDHNHTNSADQKLSKSHNDQAGAMDRFLFQ